MGMEEALEFWITQLRAIGKELEPAVVRAARAVLPEVVSYGHRDPAAAVELLARVAWQVSSSAFRGQSKPLDRNGEEIESLEQYLFRSFLKKANHPYLTAAERNEVSGLDSGKDPSDGGEGVQKTEDHAQFWEIYDRLEPKMQAIFVWREFYGYRWRFVGKLVGMSGHAAEVYYHRGIERLKNAIRGWKDKRVVAFKDHKGRSVGGN
jgi:DNA-directed RNA polymerase specialized sigma24 family protein